MVIAFCPGLSVLESGMTLVIAEDLDDGVEKAVKAAAS